MAMKPEASADKILGSAQGLLGDLVRHIIHMGAALDGTD